MPQQSSYTRAQYRDLVKGDMGLRSTNLLTDADLNSWGDAGQRLIAFKTHWLRKQGVAINVVSATALYDLPADLVALEEVYHDGLLLYPVTVRQIRQWSGTSDWRTSNTGTPTNYYLRGMTSLGLYPTPSATLTGGLVIHYCYYPAAPATDNDFYTVPTALDGALVTYGKLQGARKDMSGEGRLRAADLAAEWESDLRDLCSLVGDANEQESLIIGADADDVPWDWRSSVVVPAP